ncbi:mitogen-activated protein kinase kinase kinase 20-like [Arachis duranensis]|uniref:Mitogen-activated protein kinase kinase kinase 20-like n=1 Tax=Arachis duranensis TaxID=130453 RepID=A0A6P4BD97_ARADU|nr:mitogen-activated protein kinase kinase kinase 20-like [Arachis duranensis]
MSSLQWKKLKILGADSYGTVYLSIVVDTQILYQSFIAEKSFISRLALSLKKEEQIFKPLCEGESGGCEEIIRCFGTEITVEHERYFYNRLLEYTPHDSLDDLIHKKPLPETDIADFGLSKTKEEETNVEVWKSKPRGTPLYLSPEAFFGHIDAPMDIWALSCTMIKMLTGLPAWGESFLRTEEYLRFFVEYLELSPKKPKGIRVFCYDFLEKCFMKDPSKRWTAEVLLDHLLLYITLFHSYHPFLYGSCS